MRVRVSLLFHLRPCITQSPPSIPQLLRNSDGVEVLPTHEKGEEQETPVRIKQALSILTSATPTPSTPTPSTSTPSTLVSSTALKEKEKEVRNSCHGNRISAKKYSFNELIGC